jgi:hypothetical protein
MLGMAILPEPARMPQPISPLPFQPAGPLSKNEGLSRDVVENTRPCKGIGPSSRHAYENKALISLSRDVIEK